MASLDILCFNLFNLKKKIMKIEHKKIFCGPSKVLKNISWSINICLKKFIISTKSPGPPSYILNVGPLLYSYIWTLFSAFSRNIFSLIYLIHPNFASFFQNDCIFKKTKIFFENLNCKRGHMPIFVLKFKRKGLEKVEFLKFKF